MFAAKDVAPVGLLASEQNDSNFSRCFARYQNVCWPPLEDFFVDLLVLGGGAREHALAYKLSQSDVVNKVYVWPGNALSRRMFNSLQFLKKEFVARCDQIRKRTWR